MEWEGFRALWFRLVLLLAACLRRVVASGVLACFFLVRWESRVVRGRAGSFVVVPAAPREACGGGVGAGVRFRALQESSCAVARKGAQSSVMGYMAAYGS